MTTKPLFTPPDWWFEYCVVAGLFPEGGVDSPEDIARAEQLAEDLYLDYLTRSNLGLTYRWGSKDRVLDLLYKQGRIIPRVALITEVAEGVADNPCVE